MIDHQGEIALATLTQRSTPNRSWYSIRRYALNLFVALTGAYGLSVTGFLLLRWLVGESWSLIALFNSLVHLLLLPSLVLLPLALLLRRRGLVAILLPALLVFVFNYAPVFMPRPVQAANEDLRLLTFNLKAQTVRLDSALAVIRDSDADVVALQEVSMPFAAQIVDRLAEAYPYQALNPQADSEIAGQAVISRYPVLDDEYRRLNLAAQRVTLDVDGQVVTLYNVHPVMPIQPRGFIMRNEDISDILSRAEQDSGPVLLAGDFNMSDQSEDYRRVTGRYHDVYRAVGWGMGFTFPADLPFFGGGMAQPPDATRILPPLVRLDYVFHNEYFTPLTARVLMERGGSDHLPVLVSLAFDNGGV